MTYDEQRIMKRISSFANRNPFTTKVLIGTLAILAATIFIVSVHHAITYVPPEPLPTMSIFGFLDFVKTVELPAAAWVFIFASLWITKW